MQFSENMIGFSTGAICKGDFRSALAHLQRFGVPAVEISALRRSELPLLVAAFAGLDLGGFRYVSVHAPSRISPSEEVEVVGELLSLAATGCRRLIVHPDTITNWELWRQLEGLLAFENMDTRKAFGRDASEMRTVLERLPRAGVCLDLAHAERVDPTMFVAQELIRSLQGKIVQVHVSEVAMSGEHRRLSLRSAGAVRRVAKLIPPSVPVILESPVTPADIPTEIAFARRLFHPAVADLEGDIDAILHAPTMQDRRKVAARRFFVDLQTSGLSVHEPRSAIPRLPHGGPIGRGQVFVTSRDLYDGLTEGERAEVDSHYAGRISGLIEEYPDLAEEFPALKERADRSG